MRSFIKSARTWSAIFQATILILGGAGCEGKSDSAFALRSKDLKMDGTVLHAEVAETPEESANGLMFRESMPEDHGMLFIFDQTRQASFWMKNTTIPLSVAFVNASGKILEIYDMKPLDETTTQSKSDQISYAIETNQGWFQRHRISPGVVVSGLVKGSNQ